MQKSAGSTKRILTAMSNVFRLNPLPMEFDPLCDDFDDDQEDRLGALKQRVERIADLYLRGQPVPILSASLRGPFGPNWRSPWTQRTTTNDCYSNIWENEFRGMRKRRESEGDKVREKPTARHEARRQRQERAHALHVEQSELSGRRPRPITTSRQKLDGVKITPQKSAHVKNLLHSPPCELVNINNGSPQAIPQVEEKESLRQGEIAAEEIEFNRLQSSTDAEHSPVVVQKTTFTAVNRPGRIIHQMQKDPEDDSILDDAVAKFLPRFAASGIGQEARKRARDRAATPPKQIKTCTDCGIVATKWRPGPQGPATLCDSCGNRFYRQKKQHDKTNRKKVSAPRSRQGGATAVDQKIIHHAANEVGSSNWKSARSSEPRAQLFDAVEDQQDVVGKGIFHSAYTSEPGVHQKIMKRIFPDGVDIALQRVEERSSLSRVSSFTADGAAKLATESPAPRTKTKRMMMFDTPPSKPNFKTGLPKPQSLESWESAAPSQYDATNNVRSPRKVLVAITPRNSFSELEAYMQRSEAEERQELVSVAEEARVKGAPVEPSPHIELLERYTNTILTPADANRVKRIMQQSASSWRCAPQNQIGDGQDRAVVESPYLSTQAAFRKAQVEFQEGLDSPVENGASKGDRSKKLQETSILKTALRGVKRKSGTMNDEAETPNAMPSTQALFAAAEDIRFDSGSRSLTQRELSFNTSPVEHKTPIGGTRQASWYVSGGLTDSTMHMKQVSGTSSTLKPEELQHSSFATLAETSTFRLEVPARQPPQEVHLLVSQAQAFLGDWSVEKALRENKGSSVPAVC